MRVLIGYLTPEEYFYFIGDLRGQNKADVDALLSRILMEILK
jgi:ABC-2 type transport system ATP-binding protein